MHQFARPKLASRLALPLALALALPLFACKSNGGEEAPAFRWNQVVHMDWRLATLDGGALVPGGEVGLSFSDGFEVQGDAGVNSYSGMYRRIGEDGLQVSVLASTGRAGPAELMDQEQRFLALLEEARHFRVVGQRLVLSDGKRVLMEFAPS